MIKPNELRIGNYVSYKGGIIKVVNITSFCINEEFNTISGDRIDQIDIDCINPIPLTPDILGRCGFNFGEVQMNIPGHDYEFMFDKDGLKYGYNGEDGFIRETRQPMLYLHQLQNLYFALTGEELKINLND